MPTTHAEVAKAGLVQGHLPVLKDPASRLLVNRLKKAHGGRIYPIAGPRLPRFPCLWPRTWAWATFSSEIKRSCRPPPCAPHIR